MIAIRKFNHRTRLVDVVSYCDTWAEAYRALESLASILTRQGFTIQREERYRFNAYQGGTRFSYYLAKEEN